MTFGLYVARHSPLHRWPVGLKLWAVMVVGIVIFTVHSIPWLFCAVALESLLVGVAHLPWRTVVQQLRPLLWIWLAILGLHGLVGQWDVGIVLVLRFVVLVGLATLVTLTTRLSDMVDTIERGLGQWGQPLHWLGVRPTQVSLMVALTIRLIPLMLEQIQEVQDAQRARGCDRPVITLLVPILIRIFQLADHLADALDARCYDQEEGEDDHE
jgi:biotin transport system permease protein